MMRHLFLSILIVTFVAALSREQNGEEKGEGEAVAEEKSRPTRWATPSADQGNGAGAALAGVPPAANPILARPIRGVSSQSTKSHSESSHSTSSVSQTLPAPALVRAARATSSHSTQSHSESSHSSSSVGQTLPSVPARAARHSQQQGTVETHRPARWATPTADQNNGAQPAIATFDHPVLARPARGVTSKTTSSHSESSQSSSVSQSQPSAPVAPPPAPARVVRNVEHKGTVGTQQQGVDQEQGRQSRAAEIQENLRNQAGSRQNRNVHTQESDGHAPVERPARGTENQGERSDHAHQIESGSGRQARNIHTQDGDNHSPLERETRAARNGGPDILLAADHGRQSRGVETHRQQSAESHIRQQRNDPSDPSKYRRLPLAP